MTANILRAAICACFLGLQLAFKAAAQAAGPEPVLVNTRCKPERSDTSACVWTGGCPRGGCGNRCILNEGTPVSYYTLQDRAMGEEFYGACPFIAYWINIGLEITGTASRRRLLAWDLKDAGIRASLRDAVASAMRPGTSALQRTASSMRGQTTPHATAQHRPSVAARRRQLLEAGPAGAPSSEQTAFRSDLASNLCITKDAFADPDADLSMSVLTSLLRDVFASAAAGEPLPADLIGLETALDYPNQFQFLIRMLEEPGRAEEYMATRCANREVQGSEILNYIYWLDAGELDKLDGDSAMVQCADTFGASEEFDRNIRAAVTECSPPFGASPDCYSVVGYDVISSLECAAAFAKAFDVIDTAPLIRIATITEAIHQACGAVQTEADCQSSQHPILQELGDIHASLPVRHAVNFEDEGPADPLPDLCFAPPCDAEAPAPEARTPEPARAVPGIGSGPSVASPPAAPPAPGPVAREDDGERLDDNEMAPPADVSSGRSRAPATMAVAAAAGAAAWLPGLLGLGVLG